MICLSKVRLMEGILHQLVDSLYCYLEGFIHLMWCRITPSTVSHPFAGKPKTLTEELHTNLRSINFTPQNSFGWGSLNFSQKIHINLQWSHCMEPRWTVDFRVNFSVFTPKVSTHGLLLTQRALELEIGPTASRCERVWFGGWWVQSGPKKQL